MKKFGLPSLSWFLPAVIAVLCIGSLQAGAVSDKGYTSAKVCGDCHTDIYESWSKSLHAISYTNPIFKTAYAQAYLATKGDAKNFCLKCHAPTTLATGDTDVTLPITSEGVTCDFCHTVESVDLDNPRSPFRLDTGGEKRASLKNARSPAHKTSYADLFNKSEMCAGCHEMTNILKTKTMTTYSEWKSSRHASEGTECQNCHMPETRGKVVDPQVKKTTRESFHDHSLSHNVAQMQGAVKVEILTAKRTQGGRFVVEVAITNVKAGHNIPTGAPTRALEIEVRLNAENFTERTQHKLFGKKIVDKTGGQLTTDVDAYLKGAKIKSDTSLPPGKRKIVRFMFSASPAKEAKVSVNAYLSYHPIVTTSDKIRIPVGSDSN